MGGAEQSNNPLTEGDPGDGVRGERGAFRGWFCFMGGGVFRGCRRGFRMIACAFGWGVGWGIAACELVSVFTVDSFASGGVYGLVAGVGAAGARGGRPAGRLCFVSRCIFIFHLGCLLVCLILLVRQRRL